MDIYAPILLTMAYTKRKPYRNRKDILKLFYQKFRVVIWFAIAGLVIYVWMNRVSLTDYLKTYFY